MNTGLFDKNETPINVGDRTRLVLDNGEVREFDVCFKTVERTIKCHPDFDDKFAKVAITGIVFCWNGYDLFPCVDENGIYDTSKMEVIRKDCENCYYFRNFGDTHDNITKDCTYELEPDYDAEGYIINEPPCERD